MTSKSVSHAAAAIALLLSNSLFAQAPPPTLVVNFIDPNAIPLDTWSAVAAGLLIAAAYAWFRHRGAAGFGRLSAWLAVIAAAAAIGASRLEIVAGAEAAVGTLLPLSAPPASIVIVGGTQLIQAQNSSGRTINIISVTLVNPLPNQSIQPAAGTNCVPGLVLTSGQSCLVQVQQLS